MKFVLAVVLFFGAVFAVARAEKEDFINGAMKKTLAKIAHQCAKRVNASVEDVTSLKGNPPYPEKSACILACLYEKTMIMEDKKFSVSGFMMSISPLTFGDVDKNNRMRSAALVCEREFHGKTLNECEIANILTSCLRKHLPELDVKF